MGSWCETCAITNTPVKFGSLCVMVILDTTVEKLKGYHFLKFGEPFGCDFFDIMHVKEITKGIYDDYGGLEGHEGQQDEELALFFHQDIWNACQNRGHQDERIANQEQFNVLCKYSRCSWDVDYGLLKEFDKVLNVAYHSRRNVLGAAAYRGVQSVDSEMQRFVLSLVDKQVVALEMLEAEY